MFEDSVNGNGQAPLRRIFMWCMGPWNRRRFRHILLFAIGAYLLFIFIALWCPPIRGVVLDAQTGKAIPTIQIHAWPEGFFMLGVENTVLEGKQATASTDSKGRFFVAGSVVRPAPGRAGFLDVFSPLQWLTHVKLAVWAPGYGTRLIKIPSYALLPWWTKSDAQQGLRAQRLRLPVWGFYVRLALAKPQSEEEWRKQCSMTIQAHDEGYASDEWLFNDLTSYLERWPEGEKAAQFFDALLHTAMMGSCEYITESYRKGELSAIDLRTHMERQRVILELSQRVDRSRVERLTKNSEDAAIQDIEPEMKCMQDLLNAKAGKKGGVK